MKEILQNSVFLGVLISLGSFALGSWLKKKTGWALANPLLISLVLVVSFMLATGMTYDTYMKGVGLISYLLTPATICLAVPLYQQFEVLKKNPKAIITGVITGVISSGIAILLLALLFSLDHATYVTLLPKSVTAAIGLGISEEIGGFAAITVIIIVITGVIGNVFAEHFLKLIRVKDPIAKGIAIGAASHVVGTARAMEMGEVEGAMSSLATVVCGLITVAAAPLFALIY